MKKSILYLNKGKSMKKLLLPLYLFSYIGTTQQICGMKKATIENQNGFKSLVLTRASFTDEDLKNLKTIQEEIITTITIFDSITPPINPESLTYLKYLAYLTKKADSVLPEPLTPLAEKIDAIIAKAKSK